VTTRRTGSARLAGCLAALAACLLTANGAHPTPIRGLAGAAGGAAASSAPYYYCPSGLVSTGTADADATGSNCSFWLLASYPRGGTASPVENAQQLPGLDVLPVWTRTRGAGVTVAVIDSGVDPGQPDYRQNLLPGRNLYDRTADTADRVGHGTVVASLIAAGAGNGGYVGIAPEAKILPVKIVDGGHSWSSRAAVAGVYWALAHGARVLNCSFGSFGAPIPGMTRALRAAAHAGALVVIAAGNEHANLDARGAVYAPDGAGLANTVTVANVEAVSGRLAPSSNWGARRVQLAALGDYLYGDYPASADGGYLGGTSAAAATVSGVAALLFAAHPEASAAQVARALHDSATPLASLRGKVASGGLVSAARALALLDRRLGD
jgi:subtilisin family serine protease